MATTVEANVFFAFRISGVSGENGENSVINDTSSFGGGGVSDRQEG